jgi:hypothetical protein
MYPSPKPFHSFVPFTLATAEIVLQLFPYSTNGMLDFL